jgi:DNA-binding CsgD family transcriptional regulator
MSGMTKANPTASHRDPKKEFVSGTEVEAEILAVVREETEAYLRGDFEGISQHWIQDQTAIRMVSWGTLGVKIIRGWEAVSAQVEEAMRLYPASTTRFEDCIRWENVQVVVGDDMARVIYDQIGFGGGPGFQVAGVQHELKVLVKVDGQWKINCIAILKPGFQHADVPLVQVDADARILWRNAQAATSLDGHGGLQVSGERLRARNRAFDVGLRDAIRDVSKTLLTQLPVPHASEAVRAVPLGEDDFCTPQYCWVFADDGRVLVSLDDGAGLDRRLAVAAQIFGLSGAQLALARLLIDGCDLAGAAERLEVSVNTVRTQLQRIFDKTGVRSQSGLVRTLLSVQSPN